MSEVKPSLWEMTAELPRFPQFQGEMEVDIAIIGGGITGLTLAYLLRNSGFKICLIERERLMRGTSGQTSAHLSSMWDIGFSEIKEQHGLKCAEAIFHAMSGAIEFIYEQSQINKNISEFQFVQGYLYRENEGQEPLIKELETCKEVGHSIVDMPKNFPIKYIEGFGVKTQGKFHPIKHVASFLEKLANASVSIFEESPVTGFTSNLIKTDQGTIKTKKIVHASHTPVGFNILQNALKPYRSFVIAGKYTGEFPDGLFVDQADPYHYIRKYTHANQHYLIIGGADTHVGSGQELESARKLQQYVREKFALTEITHEWSAQYFSPIDGIPMIGKDPTHSNHYIATGFSGDGLTMGTASAMMLADLIVKGHHPWESIFTPSRTSLINKDAIKMSMHVGKHLIKDRLKMDEIAPENLAPGQGCVLASITHPTAYYKNLDGTIHKRSAVCPHLKCIVHWNAEQNSFDCPCHASRFSANGKVIEGPALENLKEV